MLDTSSFHVTIHALQRWRERAAVADSTEQDLLRTLAECFYVGEARCHRGSQLYKHPRGIVFAVNRGAVVTVLVGMMADREVCAAHLPHAGGKRKGHNEEKLRKKMGIRRERSE